MTSLKIQGGTRTSPTLVPPSPKPQIRDGRCQLTGMRSLPGKLGKVERQETQCLEYGGNGNKVESGTMRDGGLESKKNTSWVSRLMGHHSPGGQETQENSGSQLGSVLKDPWMRKHGVLD